MSYSFYHILHLVSLFYLAGVTFSAISNPTPEQRKKNLMISGIASLIVFVSGFGLVAKAQTGFPLWLIVKIICWLLLSALAGFAYRKKEMTKILKISFLFIISLAVIMVSLKPF